MAITDKVYSGRVYQGSPKDITKQIAEEMLDVIQNAGIGWSGVHAVAMLQIVISMYNSINKQAVGVMPSFEMMLTLLTRGISRTEFTPEEAEKLNAEFCIMVESLGGSKLPKGTKTERPMILSPSIGVH